MPETGRRQWNQGGYKIGHKDKLPVVGAGGSNQLSPSEGVSNSNWHDHDRRLTNHPFLPPDSHDWYDGFIFFLGVRPEKQTRDQCSL